MTPKRVVVLGATGSVGRTALAVIAEHPDLFRVEALVAGRDVEALAQLARTYHPKMVAIADEAGASALKTALSGTGIDTGAGAQAVIDAACIDCDIVVAGIVGTFGLLPTFAAVKQGRTIALANKECLVCAGEAFMAGVEHYGARILPLDSEHNALFQVLDGQDKQFVTKMTLTASGGPFRNWSKDAIDSASVEQALAHPNWSMGPKITIDSASMMNKGLELIEAHHIFGIPSDRLDVLIHPQSIIHGLISFADGSVSAGMAMPDMRVPTAHCLAYPDRIASGVVPLDLAAIGQLSFERPDLIRFPALALAYQALAAGGVMPAVMNAANEVAVQTFLKGQCAFGAVPDIVAAVMEKAVGWTVGESSIELYLSADLDARRITHNIISDYATLRLQ
ncbi:MAG: 1-deoxy-D-xylulose-5-phosphate reductoisomerase [Hyphomicrobiales bacterium]|nr:1-deoxy-D-xylulose-5-phosphate reductoisomerase [Hyphomicrobiales bacterium]